MRKSSFKVGESTHQINYFHRMNIMGFCECGQLWKGLKFIREEVVEIGKGVATNGNGLGIELNLKNFKVWLGEVKVVVRANKMAHP
jgi:hypothetical protein